MGRPEITEKHKQERLGEIVYDKNGSKMEIVGYRGQKEVDVKFEEGCIVTTRYYSFLTKSVKNPLHKSIYNVGYIGMGNYKISNDSKKTKQYIAWKSMFERCYSLKLHERYTTYIGCSVCEEWHNFQNFAKWYDENYYEITNEVMCLDKDILVKGNKIYSPETCVFVTERINKLFIKADKSRGGCPIGVHYDKKGGKFISSCGNGTGNSVQLGSHDSLEEAFITYKKYKENTINNLAYKYKMELPYKLYLAMINYKVEMSD